MTQQNRRCLITEKIERAETGLNAAIYAHVEYEPRSRRLISVPVSQRWKDGSTLDHVLTAIGDKLTDIIRREINGGGG